MNTDDTTSNPPSPLTRLLSLASSLHGQSDLSLQQLVPVHESLIQACTLGGSFANGGAPTCTATTKSLENVISSLPNTHDQAAAKDLLEHGSEAQQLLLLQYLISVNAKKDSFQALATLVLPFLRSTQHDTNELQEALLNAVFLNKTADKELSLASLQACFQACHVTEARQWTLLCRVLVTLHAVINDTTPTTPTTEMLQDELTDFIYSTVLNGIQQALVAPNYLEILNPIVTWLLPLLFEKSQDHHENANSQHINDVWTCLMENVVDIQSQQVALVVSAVLCSMLPSLWTRELPVVVVSSDDTTTQPQQHSLAIHQSLLWKLILYSLQQGMTFANLKRGGFQTSVSMDQMLRRRGLYLLGLLIEHDREKNTTWQKYVLCFEALEMETEPHLIEQVWETVAQVCAAASSETHTQQQQESLDSSGVPSMSWEWISALLARVILSDTPILRKIGLYRFLSGHTGISMSSSNETSTDTPVQDDSALNNNNNNNKQAKKKPSKKKGKGAKSSAALVPAPLTIVSNDFVLNVILPSFDTLGQSVGTNFQFEENGKIQYQDVTPLLEKFLATYVSALEMDRRRTFLGGLFSPSIVCDLRLKTVVMIYQAVANVDIQLPMDESLLKTAVSSFGSTTSSVALYKEQLMAAFATMLSHSCSSNAVHPEVLLKTLALYPIPSEPPASLGSSHDDEDSNNNVISSDPKYAALQKWLANLGDSPSWACTVGEACASAFVMGQLFPPTSEWTPESGSSETERTIGGSIVLLCTLAAASTESNASKLLWPAIHKGLTSVPQSPSWHGADRTCRSLVLLENGCLLGVTSGVGNGDLVMDKSQRMMPPPPNVETLLSHAVDFDLAHIEALTSFKGAQAASTTGSARSGVTTRVLSTFSRVITQMQVYCSAYPSSLSVSSAADRLLEVSMEKLASTDLNGLAIVQNTALVFGALSCGANQTDATSTFESVGFMLNLNFPSDIDRTMCNIQTARSVFQYAKWGALSFLLQKLLEGASDNEMDAGRRTLLTNLFDVAEDSVYSTPADALMPLFDCCIVGARSFLSGDNGGSSDTDGLYTKNLAKIVDSLFALKSEVPTGRPSIYMLNQICSLLFRPDLLMDEYNRMLVDGDDVSMPIRDAFRHLMEMAGTERPHISRIALSHISVAWRGNPNEANTVGLGAIPYRTDICDLLLRKEVKLEKASAVHEVDIVTGPTDLPPGSDESSITRGFILLFLSSLPDVNYGLPAATLVELLHFIIFHLLNDVCLVPNSRGAIMIGGPEYSKKIRAWQALYVLSRFVTEDIADSVCENLFECIGQNLHGGIRYFVEAFAIQFARRHPTVFGRKLVKEIRRTDLSLQNVSSLLIVAGNIIVGRYKDDFLTKINTDDETVVDLKEILAGAIPWLSSTQGFTRAISQLLVHKLVPLVIDVNDSKEISLNDSDWYLKTNYQFLDDNPEMKRLRKKQSRFFDQYDVDEMCSAKALLQLEVDEGSEANPDHAVDAIKKCLEQVYQESHENETPMWKQVADMMEESSKESSANGNDTATQDDELVSFQRKIIPLDSLELDLEASRDARLKNARGRKKQQLVVCASLVDKVPNLGGLARTSEIFAAERLVIPDTTVCKMDNFKSISVGAGDWIDIEGCKEDVSVFVVVSDD